jgi:hypothetical protein
MCRQNKEINIFFIIKFYNVLSRTSPLHPTSIFLQSESLENVLNYIEINLPFQYDQGSFEIYHAGLLSAKK